MSLACDDAERLFETASSALPRFPCSSSQERCWFIDALDPGNPALNVALRWEIKGRLSVDSVEEAFAAIIARHEPLRTRLIEQEGLPMQEIHPPFRPRVQTFDLSDLPPSRQDDEVLRLGSVEAHKPFDIRQGPLIRITFVRLATGRAFLLLTVHQIAFDGWSIRLVSREFGTIAAAVDAGRPHGLPDLAIHYGDYAAWQAAYFRSEGFDREIAYWTRKLRGAPYFEVAGDRPRRPRPTFRGEIIAELLSEAAADRMLHAVQERNTTIFIFGCGVIATVLKYLTGRDDISIGTQIAGRDEPELEPIIGVFINNLVLRFELAGAERFDEILACVQGTVLDALAHQRMPFHRLVEILKPPRDPSRMPLISVNFTVLQDVMDNAQYGGFELVGHPSLSAGSLYDLNFFMVHWPTGWRMALEYNTDLFDRATAEAMLASWRGTLEAVLEEPGSGEAGAMVAAVAEIRTGSIATATGDMAHGSEIAARWSNGAPDSGLAPADHAVSKDDEALQRLVAIWRDVLADPTIAADSDFFEAGGHSILALRMLAKVEAAFGTRIGVANLFTAPTAREFCQFITQARPATADWTIVRIQPGRRDRLPLIMLNNSVIYHTLAKHLGAERPILGVQLFDPQTESALPPRSFEAIAADYVRLIRKAQPQGPYLLMGLCVAGVLAHEVARQLRAEGETVPLVVMADSWRPGFLSGLPQWRAAIFRADYRCHVLAEHWRRWRRGETNLPEILATYPRAHSWGLLALAARIGLIGPQPLNRQDWGNRWFLPHLEEARDRHQVGAGAGDLVIFRSAEMVTAFGFPSLGWATEHADQVTVQDVPGWHTAMFQDPGASIIADLLRPRLAAADPRVAEPS